MADVTLHRAEEIYDRAAVEAFTSRVVTEAQDEGLNYLELYHAANSARLAALAQMSRQASASGKVIEVQEGGTLKVTGR